MRETVNKLGLLLVISAIIYGSVTSSSSAGPLSTGGFPIHLIAYFVLAGALLVNFHDTRKGHAEAVVAAGAIAISMEAVQIFLPYRSFSLMDFFVSLSGASLVLLDHHIDAVTWFVRAEDRVLERLLK